MTTPTPVTVSSVLGDLSTYVYNPSLMAKRSMQILDQINNGTLAIVDATNPFVFSVETTACNTAAAMVETAALIRGLYPAASTTYEDLYKNMSDTDYLNMFALPSSANFTLMFQYSQLINALVYDPTTGISQITIPRNTIFTVADTQFSLQYPINIRQLQHGDLQVVYDASEPSPLLTLTNNVLAATIVTLTNGVEYFSFQVNAQQFFVSTLYPSVSTSSSNVTSVPLTDSFYACRVYTQNSDNTWNEIATTFTAQVYDPNTPTAVIQVTDSVVNVTIPPVYLYNQTIRGKLRVDVYQTKGPLVMSLASYSPQSDFTAKWYYIDVNDSSPETEAVNTITNLVIFSTDVATGGRAALTFDEMRDRVINNSTGPRQIPITPAQIQDTLIDAGYAIVKNVDVVTNRIFWATKALPSPTDLTTKTNNVFSPANANMLSVVLTLAQGATSYGCTVHDTGVTVTSQALFNTVNGISSLVSQTTYNQILAYPLLQQAALFNEGDYFYTPFYYVLDDSTDVFDVRPYFLDQPSITSRTFFQENPTTGLQVSIADGLFAVAKTSVGYQLTLTTSSNAAFQALPDNHVGCQLVMTMPEGGQAYMLGTQQTRQGNQGERTYVFNITTSYDIDANHAMDLTSFATGIQSTLARTALTQNFAVLFFSTATLPPTYASSAIDAMIGSFQTGSGAVGITYEQLTIAFGDFLPTLWNNYRSYATTIPYQTYPSDVPATRSLPLYQQDPVTGANFSVISPESTFTLSATGSSGLTGITGSFNHPTFTGTSADVGVVVNFDGGKTFTVTAFGTTESATGTLSAVASTTSFTVYNYDSTVSANNGLVWTILEPAGSIIKDSSNNTVYLHRAGDPVINPQTGLPTAQVNYTTQLQRTIDFFTISAVYRFANDPITTAYMAYVNQTLLQRLTEDLVTLNDQVLENTEIYYYPAVTQGTVGVFIENNVLVTISADQQLEVTLYVPSQTANNSDLLATLVSSTIQTIGQYLAANTTVAVSKLEQALSTVYGSDVVDVEVKGFGGTDNNYNVMTVADTSTKLSIGKILVVQTNNQMAVQEAIKVTFVTHDTTN